MVTDRALWFSVPDPFDLSIDSRTWMHYVDAVEFQARQVTSQVDISIMQAKPRQHAEHTLSDVDRAVKRLGAWARLLMVLIPYREVVCLQQIWSPTDPSISKRAWEYHLYDIRQSVVLLETETPQTVSEFCGTSPRRFDFLAGTSMPTHEQWLVLSERRACALLKRQLRVGMQSSDEFLCLWQRSLSPYCCPSYTAGASSMIRLPCFAWADVKPPVLSSARDGVLGRLECADVECVVLARLHGHPRDRFVSFVQETHSYYVNGHRMPLSVTGLVHSFAQEFRPDEVIQKMINSGRWPRPECSHQVADTIVPFSADEIKAAWSRNAKEAAAKGTWMHLQIEVLLNAGYIQEECCVELQLFKQFLREYPLPLLAFRSEWCIYGENEQLAGCIDFVASCSKDEVILFDWKRTKGLRSKHSNRWANMTAPVSHLEDCAGNHYRLQLNLYKHIIEKYYNLKVRAMHVVCCHPDQEGEGPFLDNVPVMDKEIQEILNVHTSRVDFVGGKQALRSAADIIDAWHRLQHGIQVEEAVEVALVEPVPVRTAVMVNDTYDSDEESGFWGPAFTADDDALSISSESAGEWVCDAAGCFRWVRGSPQLLDQDGEDQESAFFVSSIPATAATVNCAYDSDDESGFWGPAFTADNDALSVSSESAGEWVCDASGCFRWVRSPPQLSYQDVDELGGSLPSEALELLPGDFFSYNFLKHLSWTCRGMLRSARSREHWRGRSLSLRGLEFLEASVLRDLHFALEEARFVTVNVPWLVWQEVIYKMFLLFVSLESLAYHWPFPGSAIGYVRFVPTANCAGVGCRGHLLSAAQPVCDRIQVSWSADGSGDFRSPTSRLCHRPLHRRASMAAQRTAGIL